MAEISQHVTGSSKVAGVMGWPVEHSRSPLLHNYWLRKYNISGVYVPMAVDPVGLKDALRALPHLGFAGCNITVPHKENAMMLVDEVDELAKKVGAINTVIVGKKGKLIGRNTDVFGFTKNLESAGLSPNALPERLRHLAQSERQNTSQNNRDKIIWQKKKPALVVGAGGAARAVLVALAEAGCGDIRITNRTNDRAIALASEMNESLLPERLRPDSIKRAQSERQKIFPSGRATSRGANGRIITVIAWQDRDDAMRDCELLVNTTTQGMDGQPPLDIDLRALKDGALVTDLVYTPLHTPLLSEAKRRGHPMIDGLGMLLHQAVPGFEAWFGQTPVVDEATRKLVLADITAAKGG